MVDSALEKLDVALSKSGTIGTDRVEQSPLTSVFFFSNQRETSKPVPFYQSLKHFSHHVSQNFYDVLTAQDLTFSTHYQPYP